MQYKKFDMHCHTKEGSVDAKVTALEYIEILKTMGFGGMLFTDHDSYLGYDSVKEKDIGDFTILKGIEYDTSDFGHFIVVMPDDNTPAVLSVRGLKLEKLIELVHSNGGILGPAHPGGEPFLSFYSTGIRYGHWVKMKELLPLMDFFEGYNASENEISNKVARGLVKKYRRPATGGSDAHKHDCVGLGYGYLPDNIKSNNDFIKYIKTVPDIKVYGKQYGKTLKDKLGIFNKVLVALFYPYNKYESLKNYRKRKTLLDKD